MWYLVYFSLFLVSLFFSLLFTELVRKLALRWRFVDKPAARKFHAHEVPLLGGTAIFFSFVITILFGLIVALKFSWIMPTEVQGYLSGIKLRLSWLIIIIVSGFILMVVGLIDDKWDLRPKWKLLAQFLLALFVAGSGIRVRLFIQADFLSYLITIVWILFVTNAFNLLDNMDGLSPGIAVISGVMLLLGAVMLNEYFIAAILAVFLGSVMGFLYFNFPPAKIFMGDCGSMFIGFILAIVTVLGTYYKPYSPTLFPVAVPLLVLAVPVFDTISVVCIRFFRKQPIFQADKNHFSHRLVRLGMKVPMAVLFVYLVSLCVGLPSLLLPFLPLSGVLIIFSQAVVVIIIIAVLEFYGKNGRRHS